MRRENDISVSSNQWSVVSGQWSVLNAQCFLAPKVRQAIAQCEALCWESKITIAPRFSLYQGDNLAWGKTAVAQNLQSPIFNNECRGKTEESVQSSGFSATARLYGVVINKAGRNIPHDTIVRQQVITVDNSMINVDCSIMTADYSMISVDCSIATMDYSMNTADSSIISMDNSMINVDRSMTSVDYSTNNADNSIISMDNSTITVDNSINTADYSTISVDNSSATARLYRVGINRAGYNIPHDTIVRQQGEKSVQCAMFSVQCHPERSRRVPFAVISTTLEERSVTSEQYCNRFLSHTSFGMTDKSEAQSSKLEALCTEYLMLTTQYSVLTTVLLTIKYNNSPSRRAMSSKIISYLAWFKTVGVREPIKIPFFLKTVLEEGKGTIANSLKQKCAYET